MQIIQLQAIVEIERAGSFRKAALRLGRSQPSLTRLILQFEEELGLPIFDRSPTGVKLTDHGKRVHARALSVLAEVARLEDEADQLRMEQLGTVKLALSPVGGTALLPRALAKFRRTWPLVDVEVFDSLYPDAINLLRNGEIEMAIGPTPESFSDPAIIVEKLISMQIVLVTHKSNPGRDTRQLADLPDGPWFIHGPDFGPGGLFAPNHDFLRSVSVTRCHSLTTLLASVVENRGFSFLSDGLFRQLASRYDLVKVPVTDPLPQLNLSVATKRQIFLTPAAKLLLAQLKRQVKALGEPGAT
ncbi:LysR family transcriptional regulator [Sulfitobacter aestuarii]|uniref:LysR family transcriptional regulator n=1 Tax=Sulfitobacter aestuarii TaxID=2161676 RepID=A0ABW5U6Y6_9RHOB